MDEVWETMHGSNGWGKYPAEHLIQTVMRALRSRNIRHKTEVLEIGCGGGANLTFLVNEGFNVTAVDGSVSAVKNAKKLITPLLKSGQRCDIDVLYFEELDYAEGQFDLIIDYLALYANKTSVIYPTIDHIYQYLKPGGYFYSRVWGDKTHGAASGQILEQGTSENPEAGPCENMGVSHFFNEKELLELYHRWSDLKLWRLTSYETKKQENFIEEWVVWAKK